MRLADLVGLLAGRISWVLGAKIGYSQRSTCWCISGNSWGRWGDNEGAVGRQAAKAWETTIVLEMPTHC